MSETTETSFFDRVKKIMADKIHPVLPGNAKTFRDKINNAIGIELPEITVDDQGVEHISKDGTGMSGAIYAMGEAVRDGLDEAKKATTDAITAANNAITAANNATTAANNAQEQASAAETATQNVQYVVDHAQEVKELKTSAEKALNDAQSAIDAVSGKVDNFLIVSTANENGMPFNTKGEQVKQILGGIWFKIKSDEAISYGGSTIADNGTTEDTGSDTTNTNSTETTEGV